jgi:putative addiction module component (TIGR02574 family)
MATTTDQYMSELPKLPAEDRARLAHALLEGLDEGAPDPDAEAAWAAEPAERVKSIEDGTAQRIDGDEVRRRVRERLRAIRESR